MILVAFLRSRKTTMNTDNLSYVHTGDGGTKRLEPFTQLFRN